MRDYRFDIVATNVSNEEANNIESKLLAKGYHSHQMFRKITGGCYPNFLFTIRVEVLESEPKVTVD